METRKKILIQTGYTDKTIEELASLIQLGKIKIDKFEEAELEYDCLNHNPSADERTTYPLRFFGKKFEVWVADVAAGFKGTGPLGAIEILKMFGFDVTDDRCKAILGGSKTMFIKFYKN